MAEEFSSIGGHPVLDLLNTVDWRLDPYRRGERLVDDLAALRWAVQFGCCDEQEATVLQDLLPPHEGQLGAGVRGVRELVYDTLIRHEAPAAARLTDRLRAAVATAGLRPVAAGWQLDDPVTDLETIAHRLTRAAVDFLTSGAPLQVRQCADEACGWVYLDTSPRGNRVWCSAAGCGDRNRARRHYQKVRGGPDASR